MRSTHNSRGNLSTTAGTSHRLGGNPRVCIAVSSDASRRQFSTTPNRQCHRRGLTTSLEASSSATSSWSFTGSAVFQLIALKTERVSELLPDGIRPLSFLGYTIGGVFFASYTDSPCGPYDELAVLPITALTIAPPRLGAWGTRMLVTSDAAVENGRSVFGLPTELGKVVSQPSSLTSADSAALTPDERNKTVVIRGTGAAPLEVCMDLSRIETSTRPSFWLEVRLPFRLPLPSFAGRLSSDDSLLHYNIWMSSLLSVGPPIDVSVPVRPARDDTGLDAIVDGRPLCCLLFKHMRMVADKPRPCS